MSKFLKDGDKLSPPFLLTQKEVNIEGFEPALTQDIAEIAIVLLDEQKKEIVERMKEEIDLLGEPNDILHEDLDNILNKIND